MNEAFAYIDTGRAKGEVLVTRSTEGGIPIMSSVIYSADFKTGDVLK